MNAVTVVLSPTIVQEEEYGESSRRLKHRGFQLNNDLSSALGYFVQYVAIALLCLLLEAIIAKFVCGSEVSVHQFENCHCFWSCIIFIDIVVV